MYFEIDDYWEDVNVYLVTLLNEDGQQYTRTIVVNADWLEEEVKVYIRENLPRIKYINSLDQIMTGWLPRKKSIRKNCS